MTPGEAAFERAEVDYFVTQPRIAEARAILQGCFDLFERFRRELEAAERTLGDALDGVFEARDAHDRAGDLVLLAVHLLLLAKGGRP